MKGMKSLHTAILVAAAFVAPMAVSAQKKNKKEKPPTEVKSFAATSKGPAPRWGQASAYGFIWEDKDGDHEVDSTEKKLGPSVWLQDKAIGAQVQIFLQENKKGVLEMNATVVWNGIQQPDVILKNEKGEHPTEEKFKELMKTFAEANFDPMSKIAFFYQASQEGDMTIADLKKSFISPPQNNK